MHICSMIQKKRKKLNELFNIFGEAQLAENPQKEEWIILIVLWHYKVACGCIFYIFFLFSFFFVLQIYIM